MKNLINYIQSKFSLTSSDIELLKKQFVEIDAPAQTKLLKEGDIERHIYFLSQGYVKGYQNIDGKLVIQHLVPEYGFFTSLESFTNESASIEGYETITDCKLIKLSKSDFDYLQKNTTFWANLVKIITDEHLLCKLDRVKDFQILTAKERYLKFINQYPKLVLNTSVENIASFLGMEPQSLSRIRKQVTI